MVGAGYDFMYWWWGSDPFARQSHRRDVSSFDGLDMMLESRDMPWSLLLRLF